MVDINPAALSRPSISLSTPILANKTINVSVPSSTKAPKTSQLIPARIDLEPIYTALKSSIGPEGWAIYKETVTQFLIGRLNQAEFSERINPLLVSPDGSKEHLHNKLFAAIYGNVTREMPDQGLAPWVSANDKPSTTSGSKPVSGDAAERRLKKQVIDVLPKERKRIKDIALNEIDPYESLASVFTDNSRAKPSRTAEVPASAGGLSRMNFDLEIRKRFAQPLAVESGEFPDVGNIEGRMLPFCYEAGLVSGHASEAAQFMSIATETFIKEIMSLVFSRTRSNGPGDSGNAGFGPGGAWVQTNKYRRQLAREEQAFARGELTRDKSGLLPIEAKAASDRGPLGMSDLRLALEIGDCGLANFPVVAKSAVYGYREGELENWDDYTYADGREVKGEKEDVEMGGATTNGTKLDALPNGVHHGDQMDIDTDVWWEGADPGDGDFLDGVLDSCLAVG
ncbi:transcriptional regulator of RNA polII, SAGA, subunit-domain-containing protein [Lasiosphaeria miniovina]|uniref:Transcriptional regulator of RNA polII, SAGA, subunit-domain-containing protein n=1 Tax=Lasiosphaeria miniovina TaxID=1954250 RepID=A0AA40B3D0_9PEZI|nr:transcriptional regulator of RNA polII, SAGA, subunit-domain-containing protein [Lasiosphaeria miniovina]KAK0726958.1 transcriptional regulator of RNA polII, SAGA, subunit-domain-containing protein [Lasiosphaeria miniovina]